MPQMPWASALSLHKPPSVASHFTVSLARNDVVNDIAVTLYFHPPKTGNDKLFFFGVVSARCYHKFLPYISIGIFA